MELTEGDSLEGSAHTPIYNPHILPLRGAHKFIIVKLLVFNRYLVLSILFFLFLFSVYFVSIPFWIIYIYGLCAQWWYVS